MFAAAAVAAAAALTAISTTSTNSYPNGPSSSVYGAGGIVNAAQSLTNHTSINNNASTSNDPNSANSRPRPYISWAQYAHQRRNSLQRRKVEISKRLEKASNVNNRGLNKSNSPSNQKDNLLKNSSNQKLFDANGNRLRPREKLIDPNSIINLPFDLNHLSTLSEDDPLLKELRTSVVNEVLKIHSITTNDENKGKLNQLAYDNFNLIGNGLSIGADGHTQLDINEISQLLLQFIQSENLVDFDFNSDQLSSNKLIKLNSVNQPLSSQQTQIISNYSQRWEPKWLRKIRNIFSIPIAIVTLVFLIISNVDSNWVNLENDHRAGLWAICNKTLINKPDTTSNIVEPPLTLNYLNTLEIGNETTDLYISNTYSFTSFATNLIQTTQTNQIDLTTIMNANLNNNYVKNINKSSLLDKLNKKTKLLFQKNTEIQEDCFSRFFLKEDGQLVVLAISLVAILFHFIGLILLFIGLVFVSSNRTLYYYHSAGECLISSALLNALDVLAFATLVSSQVEQTYNYGYCFYLNMLISLITFFCSALLFIDDLINEYRSWRHRNMRMSQRKGTDPAFLPT